MEFGYEYVLPSQFIFILYNLITYQQLSFILGFQELSHLSLMLYILNQEILKSICISMEKVNTRVFSLAILADKMVSFQQHIESEIYVVWERDELIRLQQTDELIQL